MTHKIQIEKRDDGWWIKANSISDDCGPYETRAEADEDRGGLERTLKYIDEPGFWTSDGKQQ